MEFGHFIPPLDIGYGPCHAGIFRFNQIQNIPTKESHWQEIKPARYQRRMPGILTTLIPPVSALLTTLANAKGDLDVSWSADDAYISGLIARASSVVKDHCDRAFGYQQVTEIFRFGAGSYIGPYAQSVAPYRSQDPNPARRRKPP